MKITPVATIRNSTQADTASESSESMRIHIAEHSTMGTTIHKCDQIRPPFANPDCRVNKSKQGPQCTAGSNKPTTATLPGKEPALLNGRPGTRGSAPWDTS